MKGILKTIYHEDKYNSKYNLFNSKFFLKGNINNITTISELDDLLDIYMDIIELLRRYTNLRDIINERSNDVLIGEKRNNDLCSQINLLSITFNDLLNDISATNESKAMISEFIVNRQNELNKLLNDLPVNKKDLEISKQRFDVVREKLVNLYQILIDTLDNINVDNIDKLYVNYNNQVSHSNESVIYVNILRYATALKRLIGDKPILQNFIAEQVYKSIKMEHELLKDGYVDSLVLVQMNDITNEDMKVLNDKYDTYKIRMSIIELRKRIVEGIVTSCIKTKENSKKNDVLLKDGSYLLDLIDQLYNAVISNNEVFFEEENNRRYNNLIIEEEYNKNLIAYAKELYDLNESLYVRNKTK